MRERAVMGEPKAGGHQGRHYGNRSGGAGCRDGHIPVVIARMQMPIKKTQAIARINDDPRTVP